MGLYTDYMHGGLIKTADAEELAGLAVPLVAAALLVGGYGLSLHLDNRMREKIKRAEQISRHKANLVSRREALKRLRNLLDKDTYIAHTPKSFNRNPYNIQVPGELLDAIGYFQMPVSPEDTGKKNWSSIIYAPYLEKGKLDYAGLAHELGHARSMREDPERQQAAMNRDGIFASLSDSVVGAFYPDATPKLKEEMRAWDYAGFAPGAPDRESALDTYRYAARVRLLRSLLPGTGTTWGKGPK